MRKIVAVFVVLGLLASACEDELTSVEVPEITASTTTPVPESTTSTTTSAPEEEVAAGRTLSCEQDFKQILSLLRSGVPMYDYEPVVDLEELLSRSDLVLTGTIDGIVRQDPGASDDGSHLGWTVVSSSDATIIWPDEYAGDEMDQFSSSSSWFDGAPIDPLLTGVSMRGVEYVAILDEWGPATGGFVVGIHGFAIGCSGSSRPAVSVIEPLPGDVIGLLIEEIVARVLEIKVGP